MTREQLNALEKLYRERSDSLDASSYDIPELIAQAREALELREALRDSDIHLRENRGVFFADTRYGEGEGSTPLEAINNARGK